LNHILININQHLKKTSPKKSIYLKEKKTSPNISNSKHPPTQLRRRSHPQPVLKAQPLAFRVLHVIHQPVRCVELGMKNDDKK
jgi:hypothetical protein